MSSAVFCVDGWAASAGGVSSVAGWVGLSKISGDSFGGMGLSVCGDSCDGMALSGGGCGPCGGMVVPGGGVGMSLAGAGEGSDPATTNSGKCAGDGS